MSTKLQLQWRRRQVFELSSKGYSQTEIARTLQISESTISRDLDYLREQSKSNVERYIDERLPDEYEKCLVGLTAILREAWARSQQAHDRREKIQALSLAKECYSMKLELLTNATVVDDAIRFVSSHKSEVKYKSLVNNSDGDEAAKKESNELDYGEDKDQLEEKQEEEAGEISSTTNHIF